MIVSISKGDGHANGLLESDKDPLIVSHVAHVATSPEVSVVQGKGFSKVNENEQAEKETNCQ